MKTLAFITALCFLSPAILLSKQFESIHQIDGVVSVTYESPYLWVVIDHNKSRSRVFSSASNVIDTASDPDLKEIAEPINLRVCDATTYSFAISDLRQFNSIKTIRDLESFSKKAYFTTLYTLDWESNPITIDRHIIKKSSKELVPDLIEQEKNKIDNIISSLQTENSRPEKLLLIIKPSIGIVTYPIHNGMITINDEEFDFSKFRVKFKKST